MRVLCSVELLDAAGEAKSVSLETGVDRIGASYGFEPGSVIAIGGIDRDSERMAGVQSIPVEGGGPPLKFPLCVPRQSHGVVELGRAGWLLAGGLVTAPEGLRAIRAVERVDVRACLSERLPDLPFETAEPLAAALPDGRVIVAGGYDDEIHGRSAVLDRACSEWQSAPGLPSPRAACARPIALGDRHLLFPGGYDRFDGSPARGSLVLDTLALSWTVVDLDVPAGAAVIAAGGAALVIGGYDEGGAPLGDVIQYAR